MADKTPTIIQAIQSEEFFRPLFKNLDSWENWLTFLKVVYGLPLDSKSHQIFTECTGLKSLPKNIQEIYAIVGRRGGKSYISAVIACYEALFGNWEKWLSRGERAWIFCIATDRRQGKILLDFIKGILELFPDIIADNLAWEVRLKNRINITVKTCNYRAGRGFTTACVVLDELAFYRDENSSNPAEELIASLLPGLLPKAMLIGISTPYARFGYLYQIYKNYFGKDNNNVLVWRASTGTMNPTYQQSLMDRLHKRDKVAFNSEYLANFREDIESYVTEEMVEAVTQEGFTFNPPKVGIQYSSFVDPSGGRQDGFAMAIGHIEEGRVIVDRLELRRPPFNPNSITEEYSQILKLYRISKVFGDRYAGEWPSSSFRKHGISYETSPMDTNSIYLEFQPLISMHKISLPDNDVLKTQLVTLERKPKSGGKDIVEHPRGLHDDLANSTAGLCVLLYGRISQRLTADEILARLPYMRGRERVPSMREAMREAEDQVRQLIRGKWIVTKLKNNLGEDNERII